MAWLRISAAAKVPVQACLQPFTDDRAPLERIVHQSILHQLALPGGSPTEQSSTGEKP